MRFCPITLDPIEVEGQSYSTKGLRILSATLKKLSPLEYTVDEQLLEAVARADKMSIQGFQPKLSSILRVKEGRFEVVDNHGRFILKPPPPEYAEVPANESLTMTLAKLSGIEIPDHGLVYAIDGSLTYWIRRFDREGRGTRKFPQEDFAQLLGRSRETKYDSSMEQVVSVVDRFCTFPVLEKRRLALLVLFCFLTGNEDMHLKNFSLVTRIKKDRPLVRLRPAYDLLNTTVILKNPPEEVALPIRGKKRNLTRSDLLGSFCHERCGVTGKFLDQLLETLSGLVPRFDELIGRSFLSKEKRNAYRAVLHERSGRLGIG